MSPFELLEPERFTTGTVGPPGARVFYLQAVSEGRVLSFRLEKGQVAALAEYLARVLADLPTPAPEEVPNDLDLIEPVVAEWVVGSLGVVFDEERDRMLLRADEVADEDDPRDADDLGVARFALTRPQVAAFVAHAATVVLAGRPSCPLCHRPVDADGHVCIKTNGHRPA